MVLQSKIVNLFRALDYPEVEGSLDGFCAGYAAKFLEACVLGKDERDRFDAYSARIINTDEAVLVAAAKAVKEKVKFLAASQQPIVLDEEETELLEILAFFDSLMLYQNPKLYAEVFNTNELTHDEVTKLTYWAGSDAVKESGGLSCSYTDAKILTKAELTAYVKELENIITVLNRPIDEIFGFTFDSENHRIAAVYSPKIGWEIMDVENDRPISTMDPSVVADSIEESLVEHRDQGYIAFEIRLIMKGNSEILGQVTSVFDTYKQKNLGLITAEIASRSCDGYKLIHYAAYEGEQDIIRALSQYHPDYDNDQDAFGFAPIHAAVQSGHKHIISQLAELGASLETEASNGMTAAKLAVFRGRVDLIDELAKYSVNWDSHNDTSTCYYARFTAIYLAALRGHEKAVAQLIKYGADSTIAWMATAQELKKLGATRSQEVKDRIDVFQRGQPNPDAIAITPYNIAVIMGHQEVINILQPKVTISSSHSRLFLASEPDMQESEEKENVSLNP